MLNKVKLGKKGEDFALEYLKKKGYRILYRNYRVKTSEIDIVARDGDIICFIEVKTRTDEEQGHPFEAISRRKQIRLSLAALHYLQEYEQTTHQARFDAIAVIPDDQGDFKVELLQNAFESIY